MGTHTTKHRSKDCTLPRPNRPSYKRQLARREHQIQRPQPESLFLAMPHKRSTSEPDLMHRLRILPLQVASPIGYFILCDEVVDTLEGDVCMEKHEDLFGEVGEREDEVAKESEGRESFRNGEALAGNGGVEEEGEEGHGGGDGRPIELSAAFVIYTVEKAAYHLNETIVDAMFSFTLRASSRSRCPMTFSAK